MYNLRKLSEELAAIDYDYWQASSIEEQLLDKDEEDLAAIVTAFAFYKKHRSYLEYPPEYNQGKNYPVWENVVLIPDQAGKADYTCYKGIWINLHFVSGHVSIVIDVEYDKTFEDHSELVAFLDAEDQTVFEKLIVEHIAPYTELLTEFFGNPVKKQ
jgi:hypothetical protein